ncbi:MAG: hypothetical protein JWP01_4040 [Myxococcales bacterium]|nr:hypothetical protein [Myxococcales bacterium]
MNAARRLWLLAALASSCHRAPPIEHAEPPLVGISIAFYQHADTAFGVVDDRRWVEVIDGVVVLDRIEPAAALPSLMIEPVGTSKLVVGQCARDRVTYEPEGDVALQRYVERQTQLARQRLEGGPAPAPPGPAITVASLRCRVTGAPGRHLVRVLYVSPALRYRAQHDVTMTVGDRATVTTRFAITTPAWASTATVTLHEGVPGGASSPRELARSTIQLDGSTAILSPVSRDAPARLQRIYTGAQRTGEEADQTAAWGRDSRTAVWVWLELSELQLPPGAVFAHVEVPGEAIRDVEVPSSGRDQLGAALRVPLWVDDTLHGMRTRVVVSPPDVSLGDRFEFSVANTGEEPREVWIEEPLRPARQRHYLGGGRPSSSVLVDDRARTRLLIKPGTIERAAYTIAYVF